MVHDLWHSQIFSRVTLRETGCVAQVDQILKETGADPKQIIIEMTESSRGYSLILT